MKSTDIKQLKWNNEEVSALYMGSTLLFLKEAEDEQPNNILAGKFGSAGEYTFRYNDTEDIPIPLNSDNTFSLEVNDLTNCQNMFYFNKELTSITSFPDTSNVTNMYYTFANCWNLNSVNLKNCDLSNASFGGKYYSPFHNCIKLCDITGPVYGISNMIILEDSPLTNSSAMVFINGLAEVTTSKTITFKSDTYNTLTEDQIALATSKGWSVVSK